MSIRQAVNQSSDQRSQSVDAWKSIIEKMKNFNEIALLEYSTKNNPTFRKMFPCNQNAFIKSARCNLCETASVTNFSALLQHIQGRKHVAKVNAVVESYRHPTINPFRNQDSTKKTESFKTSSSNEGETRKTGESKIVINPVSVSAEKLKQSSESTRDIIADKRALREQMSKMTLADLLLIEYRFINTGWQKLFEENNNFMVCTMCKSSPLPHLSAMRQHLNERKHQTNIDLTKGLYHPKYAPIKDDGPVKEVKIPNKPDKQIESTTNQKDNKNSEIHLENSPKESVNETKKDKSNDPKANSSIDIKQEKSENSPSGSLVSSHQIQLTVTSKQKSLTNMFRTKMLALNIEDLKKIEYRYSSGSWKKMLIQNNSNQIKCMLCNLIIIQSLSDIKQHIAGKKHQLILDSIALLYHPSLANTKTDEQDTSKKISKENVPSDQIFRQEIHKLSLEDIKQVEYTTDNKIWKKLISVIYGTFKCTLCNAANISSVQTLSEHLKGKRHGDNMNSVKKFYHPTKTFKKDMENLNQSEEQNSISKPIEHSIVESKNSTSTTSSSQSSSTTIETTTTSTTSTIKSSDTASNSEPKSSTTSQRIPSETTLPPTKAKSDEVTTPKSKTSTASEIVDTQTDTTPKSNSESKPSTSQRTPSKTTSPPTKAKSDEVTTSKSKTSTASEIVDTQTDSTPNAVSGVSGSPSNQIRSADKSKDIPKSSDAASGSSSSNKLTPKSSSRSQSTSENASKRGGRIVCTIELEDSPEREIKIEKSEEKSVCVINPVAVMSNSPHTSSTSHEQNLQSTSTPSSSERQVESHSQATVSQPTKTTSIADKPKIIAPTVQSANNMKKPQQQNQKKDKEITPRMDRNKPSPMNDRKKTSFSTKIFSSKIERDVEGLIGVEYVVKILRNVNDSTPRYECCLCEVEVDGVGMQWHLKGLHHRMKFLERHFPTAMRSFSQFKNDVNMSAVMAQIADKMSVAIEKYHGRDLPYECLYEEFRSNRHGIMSKVFSFKHASELSGPSFTDVIDKKTVDEFIANRTSYKNPQPDPKRRTTFDSDVHFNKRQRLESPKLDVEEHRRLVEQFLESTNRSGSSGGGGGGGGSGGGSGGGHRRVPQRRRRSRSRSRSPHRYIRQRRSQSPRSLRRRSRSRSKDYRRYSSRIHNSPTRDGDIWQIYRRQFDRALEDLEKQYERYREDPESHPRYDEEWRQFWSRRTDEIIAEGRNPTSHNFQPEWVKFFIHRINELYEEAVEDIRMNLRKKLGLGLQNTELLDDRYHVGIDRTYRPNKDIISHQHSGNVNELFDHARADQQQINMEPPQMQRIHYMQQTQHMQQMYQMPQMPPYSPYAMQQHHKMQQQQQLQQQQQQQQQQMKFPQESKSYPVQQSQHEQNLLQVETVETIRAPVTKGKQQGPSLEPRNRLGKKNESRSDVEFDTEAVTPVSVLRILTALEDQLGSLGPKVIDLLSKALTLEKVKPNTAVESLLNIENCVFLETVCEKLKGQLLAGLAEPVKIRAVKKAIKDVSELLSSVSEKLKDQPPEPPKPPVISNVAKPPPAKPVSRNTEKRELASKLATALSAQGKTDFTTEQLEQLVTVYSMINKKTRETTATSSQEGNDAQRQPQKSLSDTLADLMKSTDDPHKEQHFNRNTTSVQNSYNTSHVKPYMKNNNMTTSDNRPQSLTKPYDFGMLSTFDTSLRLDKPITSSTMQSLDKSAGRNMSTDMLNKILSNVNQNSNNSTQNPGTFSGNRSNYERNIGFLGAPKKPEQQTQIPSLLQNMESNQMYGQQQSTYTNNYSIQGRSSTGGPMVSYPSNAHLNQQGRSGFRSSQDNSSRQAPMGWGGRFGNKR